MDTLCQKNFFGPKIHTDEKKKLRPKILILAQKFKLMSKSKIFSKLNFFDKNWTFGTVCMKKEEGNLPQFLNKNFCDFAFFQLLQKYFWKILFKVATSFYVH